MLQYSFINRQEICPDVSVSIQITQVVGVGLTYNLTVSSSDGCVLQECPLLVSPGERLLNITLMDGIEYNATLVVSNDCGSGSTTVSIQPEGENTIMNYCVSIYTSVVKLCAQPTAHCACSIFHSAPFPQ